MKRTCGLCEKQWGTTPYCARCWTEKRCTQNGCDCTQNESADGGKELRDAAEKCIAIAAGEKYTEGVVDNCDRLDEIAYRLRRALGGNDANG